MISCADADFPTASLLMGQPEDPKDLAARPAAIAPGETNKGVDGWPPAP